MNLMFMLSGRPNITKTEISGFLEAQKYLFIFYAVFLVIACSFWRKDFRTAVALNVFAYTGQKSGKAFLLASSILLCLEVQHFIGASTVSPISALYLSVIRTPNYWHYIHYRTVHRNQQKIEIIVNLCESHVYHIWL
jgi:hypothetical protein